jgi:hypothetical protein
MVTVLTRAIVERRQAGVSKDAADRRVLNVFVAGEEEERELKKRCRKLKTLKWALSVICFAGAAKHL